MHRSRGLIVAAIVVAVIALASLAPAGSVRAFDDWCWNDPTLVVNGTVVHIGLGAPMSKRSLVRASSVTVSVPDNVKAHLTGAKGANFPMQVTLVRSGTWSGNGPVPVTVTGQVNVDPSTPTGLKVWQPGRGGLNLQTTGSGGAAMTLTFAVQ